MSLQWEKSCDSPENLDAADVPPELAAVGVVLQVLPRPHAALLVAVVGEGRLGEGACTYDVCTEGDQFLTKGREVASIWNL